MSTVRPTTRAGFRSGWLLLLLWLLMSCSEQVVRWDPMAYTVKHGDTLYSIAWRYEMDYRQIAEWNKIEPPYAIYPGQRLVMQAVNQDGPVVHSERPQLLPDGDTLSESTAQPSRTEPQETESKTAAVTPSSQSKPEQHRVASGDTLYSIARRHGLTHHQIARWNHLRSPYVLKPGQRLRLSPPSEALGSHLGSQSVDNRAATIVQTQPLAPASESVATGSTVARTQPIRSSTSTTQQTAPPPGPISVETYPATVADWQWPLQGKVVQTYKSGDTARKGISIRSRGTSEVRASAEGSVVYSGNGLINYGNLVIIKHNNSFLSAYAHNDTLLVKEGDWVKQGQKIAKIGSSQRGGAPLHFEIRRNGKPVNPLQYLPKS